MSNSVFLQETNIAEKCGCATLFAVKLGFTANVHLMIAAPPQSGVVASTRNRRPDRSLRQRLLGPVRHLQVDGTTRLD